MNVGPPGTRQFTFRRGPGQITSAIPFSYAVLNFPGKTGLEVHLGIKVQGSSRMVHECDICVIREDEASRCRQRGRIPRASAIELAIECKYYTSDTLLGEARGYIGLVSDLVEAKDRYFVTNIPSSNEGLLAYHKHLWHTNIYPLQIRRLTRLRGMLQSTFANYRAKR